jgi:hypothetical protein
VRLLFVRTQNTSMKWKMVTAKPTKITRADTTPRHGLEHYCRDLNGWLRSWMGLEKDLPPGEQLVTLFRPFLEHLAMSNLTPRTIQKHVDNIWVLGGEFITELNYTPSLRKAPVEKVLADMIKDGGPILHHGDSEEQQRSFDSTCRKLWRYPKTSELPSADQLGSSSSVSLAITCSGLPPCAEIA